MRGGLALAAIWLVGGASSALAQVPQPPMLPTGQALTPLATPGAEFAPLVTDLGPDPAYMADGASAIAVSPDKREMLVLTSGYNRYNGADGKVVRAQSTQYVFRYAIDRNGARRLQTLQVPNSFSGIAWLPASDGFIVGGGVDDAVYLFARHGADFSPSGKISLGHKTGAGPSGTLPQTAGVAVSPDGRHALAANYYNDSLSLVDLARQKVVAEQDLRPGKIDVSQKGIPGGEFPFAVAWTDRNSAWVSCPRDRQLVRVSVIGNRIRVVARVKTVGQPTVLLVGGRRLFATEDNADRLAVLDPNSGRILSESRLRLPKELGAPTLGKGLNPNSLAITSKGLLVTLGGINAVAQVSLSPAASTVDALIPTGWYPSAIATDASGSRVFVVNRKSPPGPNPRGCAPALAIYRGQPNACGSANQYIWQLEKAGLLQFPLPDPRGFAATTLQVARNIGLPAAAERAAAAEKMAAIRARVKHVVFIIKENRTYDQVLGDLEVGNGDPRLAILGRTLSPNHHRLARQFVTLDNFYDSGEVSAAGWSWSTAARATDVLEKTVPVTYADRGLSYESEEIVRDIHPQQTRQERYASNPTLSKDPDLLAGPALLTSPDPDEDDKPDQGYLWDAAIRAGLSVRNYGFSDASNYDPAAPGGVPIVREPFSEHRKIYAAGDRLLASRSDPYYRGFDLKLPDFWREREWEREYDQQEAAGTLPALTLLRLGNDHFGSFDKAIDGVNTVETQMADNDLAIGKVIERIARGKAASSTLVFVIEDDAQNGVDHVDARRSLALVAGPYVRQGAVVSTRYTTINVLRTIGAVLGLKPLNLNDALAMPMADLFDPSQTQWSYRAEAADILRSTQLPITPDRFTSSGARTVMACPARSASFWTAAMTGQDFSKEDRLDTPRFNSALWSGLGRGPEPQIRDGRDLSKGRSELLSQAKEAPCAS